MFDDRGPQGADRYSGKLGEAEHFVGCGSW